MITSRQNTFIKSIRALSDKKERDEKGLYTAEGIKPVREAILSGQKVKYVLSTEKAYAQVSDLTEPRTVIKTEILSEDVFKSLSGEVTPQGVMAVIEKPDDVAHSPTEKCLFLDGIQDPSNVGAIIRTAAAAGYGEIYAAECADPFGAKSVRASMSGIYKVKIFCGKRDSLLKLINCPIIVADMDGEPVGKTKLGKIFCLVIGNEGNGVSETVKKRATKTVSIPMCNGMESLNAAVSAGILMYSL